MKKLWVMLIFASCLGSWIGGWFAEPASAAQKTRSLPSPAPSVAALPAGPSKTFEDEIERDYAVRSTARIQITNLRGGIRVQGWALDKIRVKARRKASAFSEEEAKRLFSALDFRYEQQGRDIELSAQYGRGLEIGDRLKERKEPRTSMEMVVFAPANMKLNVWAAEGSVTVENWRADMEVRTSTGGIKIDDIRASLVSVLCPSCTVEVNDVEGSLRCIAGSGDVGISKIQGDHVYVETTSGSQKLSHVANKGQLYVAKQGKIQGSWLGGHIEFHTQSGDVNVQESSNFISGKTESGNVLLGMRSWKFADKALIESVRGNIQLTLPPTFIGELDAWSLFGKAVVGFRLFPIRDEKIYGPEPANRFRGQVGEGGEQLKVYSQTGDVRVLKGA